MKCDVDVAVIGAGPAGSVAATMLADRGLEVLIVEAAQFPRFSIGESLLPQVTECLETAGMIDPVNDAGFQYKNGAHFVCGDRREYFYFEEKSAAGPFHAWEVKRADFDWILANEAERRGVEVSYRTKVESWEAGNDAVVLGCRRDNEAFTVSCRFLADASGFGRVMAKLADLEYPSDLPPRRAMFRHLRHNIAAADFDPDQITIAQAAKEHPYWFWLIPFSDGAASFGLVGDPGGGDGRDDEAVFRAHVDTVPLLKQWLANAEPITELRTIAGYSCNVKSLVGDRFVLLGNAAEFVDPIFSSGVAIACRSAVTAAPLIERELNGESVDWYNEYEKPMRGGVGVFRAFVEAWYEGTLSRIIYAPDKEQRYKRHICSILAGYVWDPTNPFARSNLAKLRRLANAIDGRPA